MRIVVALEYRGVGFCGWQSQPQGCGVQDALEAAVSTIAGEKIAVTAAGRTDTGVHAAFQVAHFDTRASRPLTAWVRGVNSHLPPGVAVLWAREVNEEFHARFAATQRGYRYVLLNHPGRPGLHDGLIGWHHRPLDADVMNRAAAHLIGQHDFSAFRAAECQAKSPVKELRLAHVERRGDYLLCDFRADGFILGPGRSRWLYPIGSVARTGAVIAGGSDWSVSSLNPLLAIQVALTRRGPDDPPGEAWIPEERVDLTTMLRAYTVNGAWLSHEEAWRGTLEAGRAAHLIVLDRDLYAVPPSEIGRAKVLLTPVDGREVFRDPSLVF